MNAPAVLCDECEKHDLLYAHPTGLLCSSCLLIQQAEDWRKENGHHD